MIKIKFAKSLLFAYIVIIFITLKVFINICYVHIVVRGYYTHNSVKLAQKIRPLQATEASVFSLISKSRLINGSLTRVNNIKFINNFLADNLVCIILLKYRALYVYHYIMYHVCCVCE